MLWLQDLSTYVLFSSHQSLRNLASRGAKLAKEGFYQSVNDRILQAAATKKTARGLWRAVVAGFIKL
ncbi:MAG: hypothetical protein IJF80_00430 [Clostridia bacterium]|nr:hypothetical protein [Clostridia bacterium]